jgi:Cu2+-containing amine oxidase
VRKVAKTEKYAQIKLQLYDASEFHVVNPLKKTRVGNRVGYKLVPGPQKRAAFTNNQIWITPYNKTEQWAGGSLVYQSQGDATLQVWYDMLDIIFIFLLSLSGAALSKIVRLVSVKSHMLYANAYVLKMCL